ncbi:unnamed protein product [Staurois parvus]|uniref:Uncharacterized protein n=1 Tax=Staurois parvus TaxID=386267 RepID=A0ABN9F2J6_9NEOB|nr:unnamed protein product [Staurois parvus]
MKTTSFNQTLDTDKSHKTALTADEKRYLAVFIFTKIIEFPCSVHCGRPDIVNAGSWV